jgi:hypothetical protein
MSIEDRVTVETSLVALSEAVGKASDDLRAVRATLDLARTNIATRNTTISRDVLKHSESAIVHMRETDQALRRVLQELHDRD